MDMDEWLARLEVEPVFVTPDVWDSLMAILDNPPEPSAELLRLMRGEFGEI